MTTHTLGRLIKNPRFLALPALLLLLALLASGCHLVLPVFPPTSTPLASPTTVPRLPGTPLPTITPTPQNMLQVSRFALPHSAGVVNLLANGGQAWVVDSFNLLWRLDPASGQWAGPVDLLEGSLPTQRPVEPRQLFLAAGQLWVTLRGGGIDRAIVLDPESLAIINWADLSGVDFNQGLAVRDKVIFPPNIYSGKTGELLTGYEKMERCYSYSPVGAINEQWSAWWILGRGLGLVSVEYPNHCRHSLLPDAGLPGNFTIIPPHLWRVRYIEGRNDPLLLAFLLQDILNNAFDPQREKELPVSPPRLQTDLPLDDPARPLMQPLLFIGSSVWAFQPPGSDGLVDALQLDATSGKFLGRSRFSLPTGNPSPTSLSQTWVDGNSLWLPLEDSIARVTLPQ